MILLLSLSLIFTPISTVSPIYEDLKLSETLTIRAEYLPIDTKTTKEGMVFTVEDFILVQAEIESSVDACNSRMEALKKDHLSFVSASQQRCERQFQGLVFELEKAELNNEILTKSLKQAQFRSNVYKWLTVGLGAFIVTSGAYFFISI